MSLYILDKHELNSFFYKRYIENHLAIFSLFNSISVQFIEGKGADKFTHMHAHTGRDSGENEPTNEVPSL